jgi:hypothetical protein
MLTKYTEQSLVNGTKNHRLIELFINQKKEEANSERETNTLCSQAIHFITGTHINNAASITTHLACLMAAGCYRLLHKNIDTRDQNSQVKFSGPIPRCPNVPLSSIYRVHPMPLPIRTYDIMPLLLRSCAVQLGVITSMSSNLVRQDIHPSLFFMSILNRLTGRPGIYAAFREYIGSTTTSPYIPLPNEIDVFLQYLNDTDAHKLLFSHQHKMAIPIDIQRKPIVFDATVRHLSNTYASCLSTLTALRTDRSSCVDELCAMLDRTFKEVKTHMNQRHEDCSKTKFLSHQIICDLEEIYDSPFGFATTPTVVAGVGSEAGATMLGPIVHQQINLSNPTDEANDLINTKKETSQRVVFNKRLDFLLDTLTSSMNDATSEHHIAIRHCMGCRIDTEGRIVVKLNGRVVNSVDAEHALCKLYIGASKTISSRSTSQTPKTSIPGMYPLDICHTNIPNPFCLDEIRQIANEVLDGFASAVHQGAIRCTPEIFLLPKEEDPIATTFEHAHSFVSI